MLEVRIGDMFESKAQTFVNTVNCVGIMGKGIALGFKTRFPEMFTDYQRRCERGEVRLGRPYLYGSLIPPWILNFPTKDHWRSAAKLSDIVSGLEYLLERYKEWGIKSIAVPPLGCGEGQLEWRIVGPTLYRYLKRMDIPVELFAPYGTPSDQLQLDFLGQEAPLEMIHASPAHHVKPAWVALVEILRRIEEQPYHHPVGRTAFQKIAYVATDEGLPTGLDYQRGSYGPFSPEVKKLASRLVNNGLIREERFGRMHAVRVGPTYEDARKAYAADLHRWEATIQKIADLFMRTDTKQAEVVATVLFAARELRDRGHGSPSELDVVNSVMDWKQRRKPALGRVEVATTVRNLAALGWLKVKASNDLPLPELTALDV